MNKKLNNLIDYLNKNNFHKEAKLLKEAMPIYFKDEAIRDFQSHTSTRELNESMKEELNKIKQDIEILTFFENPIVESRSYLFSRVLKYIKDIHQSDQNPHFDDETGTDTFIIEKQVMLQAIDDLEKTIEELKHHKMMELDIFNIKKQLEQSPYNFLVPAIKRAEIFHQNKIEILFEAFDIVNKIIKIIKDKLLESPDPEKITFVYANVKGSFDLTKDFIIHDIIGHSLSQYFEDFKKSFDNFFSKVLMNLSQSSTPFSHQDIIQELYDSQQYSHENKPFKDVFGQEFFSTEDDDAMMDIYVTLIKNNVKPQLPEYIKDMGDEVIIAFHEMEQKINWIKVRLETGETLKDLMGYYIFNFPGI
jgi:hypothetical protein